MENRHTVTCSCGFIEVRETAYVRTICECGLVRHSKDLSRKNINTYFQHYHDQYLKRILAKHFVLKKSSGPSAKYGNKGELFDYWLEDKMNYFNSIAVRKNWKRQI